MMFKIIRFSKIIIKSILDLYYFTVIQIPRWPVKKIQAKTLLIIRLDAIGDYILFRNFLEVIRKEERYRDYKITLLGNNLWRSLSEELDREFVDIFIWLDRNLFIQDKAYRKKIIHEINATGYEIVISPMFSRAFIFSDTIIKLIHATEKIGSVGDLSSSLRWQKKITDKYYTTLIPAQNDIIFEFNRNKEFFENLLQKKIEINKPLIVLKNIKTSLILPKTYAVLFIGASNQFRKWNIEGFASIATLFRNTYGFEIVLCGGPGDREDANAFTKYVDYPFVDLVGKTSLVELLGVIHGGKVMLSNETSAPHMAVALGMEHVFVIYNGNHYGRFVPYPKEMVRNYHVIYHPDIEKDLGKYKEQSNRYDYRNRFRMDAISVEVVKKNVERVLLS